MSIRKGNVKHSTISRNGFETSEGVNAALDKVRQLNDEELSEEIQVDEKSSKEIRDLILFGKVIEDFNIGGYVFKITTLSNRQQQNIVSKLLKLSNEDRVLYIKIYTLAEAILSVNGSSLLDIFSVKSQISDWDAKIEILSEFQFSLIETLFNKYETMVLKSNKLFSDGSLNSEIKN